jgi:hypothetical protein
MSLGRLLGSEKKAKTSGSSMGTHCFVEKKPIHFLPPYEKSNSSHDMSSSEPKT